MNRHELTKEFSWMSGKRESAHVVTVDHGFFATLFTSRQPDERKLIERCFAHFSHVYILFTELNDDLLESFKLPSESKGSFFLPLGREQLPAFFEAMHVGGWALLFSNSPIGIKIEPSQIWDVPGLEAVGTNSGADLIIDSYLDDSEWRIYWRDE